MLIFCKRFVQEELNHEGHTVRPLDRCADAASEGDTAKEHEGGERL